MRRLAILGVLVGCAADYGPASESTVIIRNRAAFLGGTVQTNVAIFGTEVRYASGGASLVSDIRTIAIEDVDAIIDELEAYDFLDRDDRSCNIQDGFVTTITVRLAAGENSASFKCGDMMTLANRIDVLSGYDAWFAEP